MICALNEPGVYPKIPATPLAYPDIVPEVCLELAISIAPPSTLPTMPPSPFPSSVVDDLDIVQVVAQSEIVNFPPPSLKPTIPPKAFPLVLLIEPELVVMPLIVIDVDKLICPMIPPAPCVEALMVPVFETPDKDIEPYDILPIMPPAPFVLETLFEFEAFVIVQVFPLPANCIFLNIVLLGLPFEKNQTAL